jgi:general nucleoside transport system permease protein
LYRLEKRASPSSVMRIASPILAAVAMLATGFIVFTLMGKDPVQAFHVFFIKPINNSYGFGELLLKATPLILCGLGVALCYRTNVWNIGAEGQLTMGAIAGGGIGLWFGDSPSHFALPLMLLAGAMGGALWGGITAFLRIRFNTNEILVSLMLVYIAQLLLSYLVHGPWRDPAGFNFPQSRPFGDAELLPILIEGTRVSWAFIGALVLAVVFWFFSEKTFAGFRLQVAGLAPAAAAYAGFSEKRNIWLVMLLSGATAGLAGICEVAGPIGQLQPIISPGYGFAAIIVAWVGRLQPLGVVLGALLMSLIYLGGESGQMQLSLPSAITGLFQGVLLFYLLAADLFINFRLKRIVVAPTVKGAAISASSPIPSNAVANVEATS